VLSRLEASFDIGIVRPKQFDSELYSIPKFQSSISGGGYMHEPSCMSVKVDTIDRDRGNGDGDLQIGAR